MTNTFMDTPYYMSPEVLKKRRATTTNPISGVHQLLSVINGAVVHNSYVYSSMLRMYKCMSLGIVLYEMCTQKHAYTGNELDPGPLASTQQSLSDVTDEIFKGAPVGIGCVRQFIFCFHVYLSNLENFWHSFV
ncbi:hypothetical protein AHF37_11420 [Paragonimus kellicotti]|nr:hypothetical protein AHF37_11420 [Paragonimus kellicotti]